MYWSDRVLVVECRCQFTVGMVYAVAMDGAFTVCPLDMNVVLSIMADGGGGLFVHCSST